MNHWSHSLNGPIQWTIFVDDTGNWTWPWWKLLYKLMITLPQLVRKCVQNPLSTFFKFVGKKY